MGEAAGASLTLGEAMGVEGVGREGDVHTVMGAPGRAKARAEGAAWPPGWDGEMSTVSQSQNMTAF